jgi:transcriptional regulator with XRE-family HTH domain
MNRYRELKRVDDVHCNNNVPIYQLPVEEAMPEDISTPPAYNPGKLLDTLITLAGLKSDAALARRLEVPPSTISKIRTGRRPVGARLLLRMHDVSGLTIGRLRDLMGDRRARVRFSDAEGKPAVVTHEEQGQAGLLH